MFSEPTVLVLGAGASAPFGYPIGTKLIENIVAGIKGIPSTIDDVGFNGVTARELDFLGRPYSALIAYVITTHPSYLAKEFYQSSRDWRALAEELHHTSHQSIDEFARVNPNRRNAVRLLIALELARYTYDQKAMKAGRLEVAPSLTANARASWYGKLVAALRKGCADSRELANNNFLKILTFNYDPSLGLFLDREVSRGEVYADAIWRDIISLQHLHGALEIIPGRDGRPLHEHFGAGLISSAEKFALLDDTGRSSAAMIGQAQFDLKEAKRIVTLGFDFHENNVKLLRLDHPSIARKIVALNFDGSRRFASRARRANVDDSQVWSRQNGNYPIADAIDDGILES